MWAVAFADHLACSPSERSQRRRLLFEPPPALRGVLGMLQSAIKTAPRYRTRGTSSYMRAWAGPVMSEERPCVRVGEERRSRRVRGKCARGRYAWRSRCPSDRALAPQSVLGKYGGQTGIETDHTFRRRRGYCLLLTVCAFCRQTDTCFSLNHHFCD